MCKKCGKIIENSEVFRTSTCSNCGADLHSCVNCNFFSPGNHYDCKENIDELIKDKEKSNFCDFFSVFRGEFDKNTLNDASKKAKDVFNALFS